jgi:hypothetical protein
MIDWLEAEWMSRSAKWITFSCCYSTGPQDSYELVGMPLEHHPECLADRYRRPNDAWPGRRHRFRIVRHMGRHSCTRYTPCGRSIRCHFGIHPGEKFLKLVRNSYKLWTFAHPDATGQGISCVARQASANWTFLVWTVIAWRAKCVCSTGIWAAQVVLGERTTTDEGIASLKLKEKLSLRNSKQTSSLTISRGHEQIGVNPLKLQSALIPHAPSHKFLHTP